MPETAENVRLHRRILTRYILPNERVVVATRRHWAVILPETALVAVSFVVVGLAATALSGPTGGQGDVIWFLWLALVLHWVWRIFEWRTEWFVATDKRLLLVFGLITHKVAMMPLGKVTDMNYSRSILGRVLGYGQFLLESAGQDQALRQIDYVRAPDATYQLLCDTLFNPGGSRKDDAPDDEDEGPSDRDEPRDPPGPGGRGRASTPGAPTVRPVPVGPEPVVVPGRTGGTRVGRREPTAPVPHGPVHRPASATPPAPPRPGRHVGSPATQPVTADDDARGWDTSSESRSTYVHLGEDPRP
ncbi:PH (Pleckstrin Homology) domain-containing protein [Sediminihabitans luteus]|uniref:PH (Pleckstrin Homology) domain-containing protein n=1 Tax=Sediminihabitans luteus TaxID=1138585 RepID=A0A2M9CPG6_9CELL|nr:PH domain-containing protein [Sediminihabitans luteus]PJJ73792.1 PH (Pleckstrin Homology) domain-containing protein [Sediminihabitans luteus]GIJ00468.1 hypothetical protein Slu03_28450 [Sediminihabitans luteus]